MSNNIIENQSVIEKSMFYSPLSQDLDNTKNSSEANRVKDELTTAEKNALQIAQKNQYRRPGLPAPKNNLPPSELAILTRAFIEAFSAMDKGTIDQAKNYTQLQELDLTQAKGVLDSSNKAIAKEQHDIKISNQLAKQMKEQENIDKDLSYFSFGLTIFLVVATFAAGFLTGGAADAAIPEEIEMVSMEGGSDLAEAGGSGGSDAEEVASESEVVDDGAGNNMNVGENVLSENPGAMDEDQIQQIDSDLSESDDSNVNSERRFDNALKQNEENVSNVSNESPSFNKDSKLAARALGQSSEENNAASSVWRTGGKKLFHFAVGALIASPSLAEGVGNLNVVSKLKAVATAQKDTGEALDILQQNNMFFNFLQQLVQRGGTAVEQEVQGGSDIVSTYSSISHAYSAITSGLANAV